MWIINKFTGSTPVRRPSKPRRKFVQTSYALKSQFIGLIFLSRTVKAMLIQSRISNSESHNVRTSSVPSVKRIFQAYRVLQGHPYWCRQESRTVCCRTVQLMPTLFLKLTKIWQRENGKIVDFNDPTHVWRRPSKKRLRTFTNGLYCQKLDLLTYILAADSTGQCLLAHVIMFESRTLWI